MATMTFESFHAGKVLDGTGDPDGGVEIGRDDLPYMPVFGRVGGVDRAAGSADGGIEPVGDGRDDFLEFSPRSTAYGHRR